MLVCRAALCCAGWILCCPCWTLGFSLRDPPDYYKYNYNYDCDYDNQRRHHHPQQQQQQLDESMSDPCWPCNRVT